MTNLIKSAQREERIALIGAVVAGVLLIILILTLCLTHPNVTT